MTIESMLWEYKHIPETIQKLNNELNKMLVNQDDTRDTLKGQVLTDMPHGTDVGDTVYNAVAKLIDRYGVRVVEITEEINEWMDIQKKVTQLYYKPGLLTIEERRVIDLKYFNAYKIGRIACIMRYSTRQCERYQQSALQKLNEENINMTGNVGNIAV